MHMSAVCIEAGREASDPQELELRAIVSSLRLVLGTHAHNHLAISPALSPSKKLFIHLTHTFTKTVFKLIISMCVTVIVQPSQKFS